MQRRILLQLLFTSITITLLSQNLTFDLSEYSVSDGYKFGSINSVFEDSDGLIWVGSDKGLSRFDGDEFKYWTQHENTPNMHDLFIMAQDDLGWLWMWNNNIKEFVFFHPLTEETRTQKERFGVKFPEIVIFELRSTGLEFNPSYELIKDNNGAIYFNTVGQDFIYRFHSKNGFTKISIGKNLNKVCGAFNDKLWINNGKNRLYKVEVDGKILDSITFDKNVNLARMKMVGNKFYFTELVGYRQSSVISIDTTLNNISKSTPIYYNHTFLESIIVTGRPKEWVIQGYDLNEMLSIGEEDLDNSKLISFENCFQDSRGFTWLYGHFGMVKLSIKENKFERILCSKDDSSTNRLATRGIYVDDDYYYVCTDDRNGVLKISRDNPNQNEGLLKEWSRPILKINEEELLFGTDKIKLLNVKLGGIKVIENSPSDLHKWGYDQGIWSAYQDGNKNLWVGKGDYLGVIRPGADTMFMHKQSREIFRLEEKISCIQNIIPEGKDSLWLCSLSGLYLFDLKTESIINKFEYNQNKDNFLPAEKFYYIHKGNDSYWIGTNRGLLRWDGPNQPNKYESFTINENLSNDVIYAIFEDEFDRLWLSSDFGIMSFDKKEYEVQTYLEDDGISHYEFNRTSQFMDGDGYIYFGGLDGVTKFHPKDFQVTNENDTKLLLTGFEIFDGEEEKLVNRKAELAVSNTIHFYPNDRFFRINFILPEYNEKSTHLYAWKLEGIDKEWNYQSQNSLQIGILPYGKHKLRIKGKSVGSGWSSNKLNLDIIVYKPFYLRWWFIISSLVLLVAAISMFFLWKTRMLQKEIKKATRQIVSDNETIEAQKVELQKLDKLKTQFFTNVSHELRTPLTLMMGPISRLKKGIKANTEDGKMLDLLSRNTSQLRNLVNEILDLSKLEEKKMKLEEEPTRLYDFINNHLKQFASFGSSENITFKTNLEIDKNTIVALDQKKLEKVINNLLSNAMKFTPAGGTVSLSIIKDNELTKIEISDTGRGIHPDDLDNIFDRFYQSKNQSSSDGGTGIGLALCKELIQLMGGEICVKSLSGHGTTFNISMPLEEIEATQLISESAMSPLDFEKIIHEKEQAQICSKGKTILVVEDNVDLREYQKIILSDYNVILKENGQEALEYLNQNKAPDLILSDIMMPVMDGMELIGKVKTSDELRHVPFIMLTAKTNQQVKIKALRYGIDDYLTKPFDEEELRVRISNLLKFQENRFASIDLDTNEDDDSKPINGYHLSQNDLEWLRSLEAFVIENLKNEFLNVIMLSKEMSMSESTLLRQLKKLTGMPPGKYIQELRLNQAKEYLLNRSFKTISLVAYNVGFKDSNSFSRTFKKRFGIRPSEIDH